MGAGRSLEAGYELGGPIDAGGWTLVADGIIIEPVDVTFELILRHGGDDQVLATWEHHFEPLPGDEYRAQPFEDDADVPRVDAVAGDRLVLRYTGDGSDIMMAYIPNGDGQALGGRIPYLDLP